MPLCATAFSHPTMFGCWSIHGTDMPIMIWCSTSLVTRYTGVVCAAHWNLPEMGAELNDATDSSRQKGTYSLITLGCPKNLVDI